MLRSKVTYNLHAAMVLFQEFSEYYHSMKTNEATKSETISNLGGQSPRQLLRSNSIQEELLTTF